MTATAPTLAPTPSRGIVDFLLEHALVYVTGKGGCGKTTVAASLGAAAATAGLRTLVCELSGERSLQDAFGVDPDRRGEIRLRSRLACLSIDPRDALTEWLRAQPGGAVAAPVLSRSAGFAHFVAAAPGAKELVTIGKAVDLTRRAPGTPRRYELVIVDGPATGHALGMLGAPRSMGEAAPVGPIGRQARQLRDFLAGDSTCYVAVTLPEELPVREVLELEHQLPETAGHELDLIVVNGLYPDRFTDDEAEQLEVLASRPGAPWALRAALSHHRHARRHAEQLHRLREHCRTPVLTLPYLYGPRLGPSEYEWLGRELSAQ
jgi:hypothetical protein